jgi:hypothetical protein
MAVFSSSLLIKNYNFLLIITYFFHYKIILNINTPTINFNFFEKINLRYYYVIEKLKIFKLKTNNNK